MTFLKNEWGGLLKNNIVNYSKGRPKRAIFIENYLASNNIVLEPCVCLEQGAFSAKDSLYLKAAFPNWAITATDKEIDVVKHICASGLHGQQEDAFNLSFQDKHFDLTFQSGLIVLFDNSQAKQVIKEQLRVTSKISFVFAHNKHNFLDRFISFIKQKFLRKTIFTYRCYNEQELKALATSLGYKYSIKHYDNMLLNFSNRHCRWLMPLLVKTRLSEARCFANEMVVIFHL